LEITRMKALVLEPDGQLVFQDVPEPFLGPNDVRIRVRACGICGSDVQGMGGQASRRIPPIIMGHEAAGVVEEVGAAVSDWRIGDRVTFDSTVYCGTCDFCRRGMINLCDNRRVVGVSTAAFRFRGAMAEYVVVPQHIVHRLPESLAFVKAALAEPLSVALHAVQRAQVSINDTAVVIGVGPIGLLITQCLRLAGCGRIVAVDTRPYRLATATKMGADEALLAGQDDVVTKVMHSSNHHGADVVIEAVGSAAATRQGLLCLRKGGTLVVLGSYLQDTQIPLLEVVLRQLSLNGSVASCWEFPKGLDLLARGVINGDELISAVAPLSEGTSWFERLEQREETLLRVILEP
jgi:L-iditol 2-dehydrogenase